MGHNLTSPLKKWKFEAYFLPPNLRIATSGILMHLSRAFIHAEDAIAIDSKPSLLHFVPRDDRENFALDWHSHLKEDSRHGGKLVACLHYFIDAFLGLLVSQLTMNPLHFRGYAKRALVLLGKKSLSTAREKN